MSPETISQLGGTAVICVCFVFILTRIMNKIPAAMVEQSAATYTLTLAILEFQRDFLRHDATIRGVNPTAGKDVNDRMQQARDAYDQILIEHKRTTDLIEKRLDALIFRRGA